MRFALAVLATMWVIGFLNAFNFMDGIDGIAGGQGLVAGAAWAFLGAMFWEPLLGALGLYVAVACAVFLCFNWSPARA